MKMGKNIILEKKQKNDIELFKNSLKSLSRYEIILRFFQEMLQRAKKSRN